VSEIYRDIKTGRWRGIRENARAMKVDPAHLLRVIRGERQSKRLINRLVAAGSLKREVVAS